MASETKYRLEDLTQMTGLSRRTIRFYIQKGYLDPPLGQKRGAYYTAEHLEALLKIKRLSQKNVPLKEISSYEEEAIMEKNSEPGTISHCSHIALGDGMTLVLDDKKTELSVGQLRQLSEDIVETVKNLKEEGDDHGETQE